MREINRPAVKERRAKPAFDTIKTKLYKAIESDTLPKIKTKRKIKRNSLLDFNYRHIK